MVAFDPCVRGLLPVLPQREYEAGQYKRATKTADTILAKFPHQGGES